jgi:hypothetical protein
MTEYFHAGKHAYTNQAFAEGLAQAVMNDDAAAILHYAKEEKQNVETRDANGLTLLQIAAMTGRIASVVALIKAGADVESRGGPAGYTALHFAVYGNHLYTANAIMNMGGAPDVKDTMGNTPLHLASYMGYKDLCFSLVRHGADNTAKDFNGQTPRQIVRARIEDLVDWTDKAEFQPVLAFFAKLEERSGKLSSQFITAAVGKAAQNTFDLATVPTRAPRTSNTQH